MTAPGEEPPKPRRFRRVARKGGALLLKGLWRGAKLAVRGFWWAGRTGYRMGVRAAARRRQRRGPPEG